ncbi:acyl-CoA dehydrogenase family protein, partial [Kibdelosporangium lantanae]
MRFDLTPEQELVVATVREFVETELYPYEDEVERLDEVPADLAARIRGKALAA